jgi:hypothetical protein
VAINWNSDVVRVGPGVSGKAYIWNSDLKKFELSNNRITYPEGAFIDVVNVK